MNRFKIDFFELMFLAEACIPPVQIARATFWGKLIDTHYHELTVEERARAFEWITKCSKFNPEHADCKMFIARFDPDNQYQVRAKGVGFDDTYQCFKIGNKYHTGRTTNLIPQFIVEVKKIEHETR